MTFKPLDAIYSVIDDLNSQPERKILIGKSPDVQLTSDGGLDSLDLVNLIVGIEQYIEDETGKIIVLVDEQFMSEENNSLLSIGSLASHIENIMSKS